MRCSNWKPKKYYCCTCKYWHNNHAMPENGYIYISLSLSLYIYIDVHHITHSRADKWRGKHHEIKQTLPVSNAFTDVCRWHFYLMLWPVLQVTPCAGWMNSNGTVRNLTTEVSHKPCGVFTHTHTYIYIYIYIYRCIHTHTHAYTHIHTHTHSHAHTCTHTCISYVFMHTNLMCSHTQT